MGESGISNVPHGHKVITKSICCLSLCRCGLAVGALVTMLVFVGEIQERPYIEGVDVFGGKASFCRILFHQYGEIGWNGTWSLYNGSQVIGYDTSAFVNLSVGVGAAGSANHGGKIPDHLVITPNISCALNGSNRFPTKLWQLSDIKANTAVKANAGGNNTRKIRRGVNITRPLIRRACCEGWESGWMYGLDLHSLPLYCNSTHWRGGDEHTKVYTIDGWMEYGSAVFLWTYCRFLAVCLDYSWFLTRQPHIKAPHARGEMPDEYASPGKSPLAKSAAQLAALGIASMVTLQPLTSVDVMEQNPEFLFGFHLANGSGSGSTDSGWTAFFVYSIILAVCATIWCIWWCAMGEEKYQDRVQRVPDYHGFFYFFVPSACLIIASVPATLMLFFILLASGGLHFELWWSLVMPTFSIHWSEFSLSATLQAMHVMTAILFMMDLLGGLILMILNVCDSA